MTTSAPKNDAVLGWSHFAALHKPHLKNIPAEDLVILARWRLAERIERCNNHDPLRCLTAYAQDKLIYENMRILPAMSREQYDETHRDEKVNRFGPVYRPNAEIICHRKLADIIVEAAIDLYKAHSWQMVVFDCMRTIEANWLMYRDMHPEDRASGLLAKPGTSAHNRALAVDSMFFDQTGCEVNMGGHFDHSDMTSNHRNYDAELITPEQTQNRRLREVGFQRAALRYGTLIAPLREEFWDDRMPGSPADLWRVLESVARCIRVNAADEVEILKQKCKGLSSPAQAEEAYGHFTVMWKELFTPHAEAMGRILGADADTPPALDSFTFHEWFNVLYDRDLKAHNLHLAREAVE